MKLIYVKNTHAYDALSHAPVILVNRIKAHHYYSETCFTCYYI